MKEVPKKKDLIIFALIWSLIFSVLGIYPLFDGNNIKIWSLVIAFVFLSIAVIKPTLLKKFYDIWIIIGEFIGGVISKVIMFTLYFGVFTPYSIFLRILGKDLLNKKIDKSRNSYWTEREKQPESMKNQY